MCAPARATDIATGRGARVPWRAHEARAMASYRTAPGVPTLPAALAGALAARRRGGLRSSVPLNELMHLLPRDLLAHEYMPNPVRCMTRETGRDVVDGRSKGWRDGASIDRTPIFQLARVAH